MWSEPGLQLQLATVKYWHAVGGLYIWEFFTTLDYEWRVIRGCLPYRWTILIYSFTRVAALIGVILSFVIIDTTTPINCQLWILSSASCLCMSAISASLLIVFRTIAIWNRNKVVIILVITVLGASIAFHLQIATRLRSGYAWDPTQDTCVADKISYNVLDFIPAIIADIALLLIILAGLLVLRRRGGATFGLTRLLWRQGVIWLTIGSVAEVIQLVFTTLHSNDDICVISLSPSLIIMTIASTRMHRYLVNFASGSSDEKYSVPQVSSLVFSKTIVTKRTDTTTPSRTEIGVGMASEYRPTGPVGDEVYEDPSTITGTSEQMSEIVNIPSKLDDLTRASTRPLQTISISPIRAIPQAQSV